MRYYRYVNCDLLRRHYPDSMALSVGRKAQRAVPNITDPEAHGRKVLMNLRRYFSRGPVIAVRIGGEDAINEARRVTGYTDPADAERGTIRGDLGEDSIELSTREGRAVENLVHASGNAEEAEAELGLWFP
jgi:nucleoside-diphosphate kinase